MTQPSLTVQQLYTQTRRALAPEYGAQASLEARLVVQHALGLTPEMFTLQRDQRVDERAQRRCDHIVARRLQHEPLSRIVRAREFWGRSFKVTPATLDPRSDSETLIEAVLQRIPERAFSWRFLDLGTGTGCLLITLLLEYPHAQGWAMDFSDQALEVATQNAHTWGVGSRFHAFKGSWEPGHEPPLRGSYDLIISNPPYIPSTVMLQLPPEVRCYDPAVALDGGVDGLRAYRALARYLPGLCHAETWIGLEIGYDQKESVLGLFPSPSWREHQVYADLAGHDRVISFKKGESPSF